MNWIDAHCHLSDERISSAQLHALLERSRAAGVTRWILGGVNPPEWQRQLALRAAFGNSVRLAFGLHPWWVAEHPAIESSLELLKTQLPHGDALGELGLDHGRRGGDEAAHKRQRHAFRAQLTLLRGEHPKPVVLHIVKAHGPALEDLAAAPPPRGGLVHAFTGSYEVARRYVDLGLTLSIGGALCRTKGAETLKQALKRLPREAWVLETDSPDQAPEGWVPPSPDAPENEPAALVHIAQKAAEILGNRTAPEILDQSRENLVRLFP